MMLWLSYFTVVPNSYPGSSLMSLPGAAVEHAASIRMVRRALGWVLIAAAILPFSRVIGRFFVGRTDDDGVVQCFVS